MPTNAPCPSPPRRRTSPTAVALATLAAFALAVTPARARELHWAALEVDALLESDGTLAISETQRMVFTGDWNGGERSFRIFGGQELSLRRIVRLDPATGEEIELRRGDLDEVDRWDWTSGQVVRWRSRRPEDPPFHRTQLDYRLDYRLTGALQPAGERRFRLDHDFAFADRAGPIERVVVRLRLRPGWELPPGQATTFEATNLPPGEGFVVRLELAYTGEVLPARATPPRLPPWAPGSAVALLLAGVATFAARLVRRERALGRFGGGRTTPIDRAWLEANVLTLRPEVVGAAWDRQVGSAEVAALLARLTGEGKLASRVETRGAWIFKRENLHLELRAARESFTDYERPLIDGLFGAEDHTDTESLRRRYRGTGFDPAAKIRGGLESRLKRIRGFEADSPRPDWKPTAALIAGGLLLLGVAFLLHAPSRGAIGATVPTLLFPWLLLGLVPALVGQGRIGGLAGPLIVIGFMMALLAAVVGFIGWMPGASWLHLAGTLLFALGLARATFNLIATRESAASLARRRELARARDHFARQLARPAPDLEDRWFPYLLAFGLAPQVDRWFRRFGDAASGGAGVGSRGSSGGGGGGGWSGGGGAFGGAGASASFAAAATTMSAGVAKPGSSGGGGGGGSSGGGGGGGW